MHDRTAQFASAAQAVEQAFSGELSVIRAGRATAAMLDGVKVEAYGVRVPLVQLATVTVPEPRQMLVQPFDPQTVKDIERALQAADLGLSVAAEGKVIRLAVPPLTEERRTQLVKVVKQKLEAMRVRLRQLRDEHRERVIALERAGGIGEDEKFSQLKELDDATKKWQEALEQRAKKKEEEIMVV